MKPSPDKNTSVFPHGHIDRSNWKRVKLGDVADFSTETVRTDLIDLEWYIGTENMLANCEGVVKNTIPIQYGQVRLYRKGDILISNIRPYLKKIWLATRDGGCSTDVNVIHSKGNEFSSDLLHYVLSQDAFFDYIMSNAIGTKMPRGDKAVIKNFEFDFPTEKDEQQKIVSGLSAISNHIDIVQKLVSKYDAIKKATVNLLLEQRPGWEKVKFSDVCSSFEYGVGAPAMSFDGRNKYIRITDIDDTSHEFKPTPLSSPTFFDHNHVVRVGDILFARTGASVGKSYLYCPTDGKLIFAGFLIRASICTNVADPKFIFLQTLTARYRQWVSEESMRSGQPGLNINQYKDFELYLPELSEQRKIAAQISAIDNVLKDCHAQLAKAQSLKQGMMSYFFG